MPAHSLCDQAAGEKAYCSAGGGDEAEHAKSLGLLIGPRKQGDDHGQDHSRAHSTAESLHETSRNEHRLIEGQPAQDRGPGEDHQSDEVHPLAPEEIAKPAGQQQQATEGDQVGVDDPGQAGLREAQVRLDRGQRYVDDRHVDDDQEEPGAEDDQREPASVFHAHLDLSDKGN